MIVVYTDRFQQGPRDLGLDVTQFYLRVLCGFFKTVPRPVVSHHKLSMSLLLVPTRASLG